MDVVSVWQERVLAVAHPVQIDTHHIEAGDYERRVGQHKHIGHTGCHAVRKAPAHLQAEDAEHHADGKASRVAHEYLPATFGVAEHVIIEERHEHAEGGEGEDGVDVFMRHQEYHSVEQHRHAAQPGGQTVDAVNQVDGVDDEHHGKHRDRPSRPCGYVIYKEQAVQVVNPHSGGNHHHPAGYLHHELRAVTDAYQVIGHAYQIEHHDGAETESQGTAFRHDLAQPVAVSQKLADPDGKRDREEHHRLEGYPPETGYGSLMDLAFVGHVEKVPSE